MIPGVAIIDGICRQQRKDQQKQGKISKPAVKSTAGGPYILLCVLYTIDQCDKQSTFLIRPSGVSQVTKHYKPFVLSEFRLSTVRKAYYSQSY